MQKKRLPILYCYFITYHEMKTYKKVTQEDGKILGWYWVVDHDGNVETDCDILDEYAIYPHTTEDSYIAEYLPINYCFGSYWTVEEALEAVKDKENWKLKLAYEVEQKTEEFQKIIKKNSLDERYKDKVVVKKAKEVSPYLARLQGIARVRTEEMQAENEEARSERNWKLANADYMDALVNH